MSKWIQTFGSRTDAPLRLFCFPYAGGGASVFRGWPQLFGRGVEICAMQLPGRENRIREAPFTDMHLLAARVADELAPLLPGKPFAFFGHSLGAVLAFELARELRRRGLRMPVHLFASAATAPQVVEDVDPPRHTMSDADLVDELRRLGGTSAEVLEHEELLALLLPLQRADFTVIETYRYSDEEPLDVPITVFGGLEDSTVTEEKLKPWRVQTRAPFAMKMFPGDHFFLHAHEAALVREIARVLG
jgi:medium-chain acyl-[acyl-carrier-protein] hydrolase